jgi:exopolysaccharide biosynthesis polyprenyl glycosylphosphotransferase
MDVFNTLNTLHIIQFLKKWNLLNIVLGIIDILAITVSFQFSYLINYFKTGGFFFEDKAILYLFLGILPFWLLILYLLEVTEIPRTKRYRVLFFQYFQSAIFLFLVLVLFYFAFKLYPISRLFLIELPLFGFLSLFFVRLLEYKIFKSYRTRGYNYINVVLIADESSLSFIEKLLSYKEWGYKIFAIFTGSPLLYNKYEKDILMFRENNLGILNDLLEKDLIDEVLYLKEKVVSHEVRETVRSCEELGVTFRLRNRDRGINLTNAIKTDIANEKFLTFTNIPHNYYSLTIKRITDINNSLLMIILLSPLLLSIGILIKLTSKGPIIFKQPRVGLRGRKFDLYKFRTMVADAEELQKELIDKNEMDGPVFKIKDDPRITKIGKFLRGTGFDELPQLFNILKGEMSLIGPRPPLQSETVKYKRWQLRRLSVKPGLSCFWQIKPDRNSIKFEQWMEMDLAYIDNWSLRLDLIIFLKTIRTVLQRTGL